MLDELLTHLGNMHKSVLMHSDIHKGTKIDYITDSSFQNHALLQILDIKNVSTKDWLWHLVTRVTGRLLKLFYDITKCNLTNFQLCCQFLVILNLSSKSFQLSSCNIFSRISQLFKKAGCSLIALRMYTGGIKRIGSACNTHEACTLLECFWSQLSNLEKLFSGSKAAILFSINNNILGYSFGNTGNILKKRCRSCI